MKLITILTLTFLTQQATAGDITDSNGVYFYCHADEASTKATDQLTFLTKDAGFKQMNAYQCRNSCACDGNGVITCKKYLSITKDRVHDACVGHGAPGFWECGCKVVEGHALWSS